MKNGNVNIERDKRQSKNDDDDLIDAELYDFHDNRRRASQTYFLFVVASSWGLIEGRWKTFPIEIDGTHSSIWFQSHLIEETMESASIFYNFFVSLKRLRRHRSWIFFPLIKHPSIHRKKVQLM